MHRDLKLPNLLLTKEQRIKVCDFGVARHVSASHGGPSDSYDPTFCVGTRDWMAPEVILCQSYGLPADVFSFGECGLFRALLTTFI